MAYCQEYIDFRNEFCPEMDLDDPRVFLRLEEEIAKLEKELGEEKH